MLQWMEFDMARRFLSSHLICMRFSSMLQGLVGVADTEMQCFCRKGAEREKEKLKKSKAPCQNWKLLLWELQQGRSLWADFWLPIARLSMIVLAPRKELGGELLDHMGLCTAQFQYPLILPVALNGYHKCFCFLKTLISRIKHVNKLMNLLHYINSKICKYELSSLSICCLCLSKVDQHNWNLDQAWSCPA